MKKFKKTTENFTCGNCKYKVKGNGFTNHCPKCLYSKHVDVYPGDRAETCGGLMKPVFLELEKHGYKLTHECLKCGAKTHCKTSEQDDIEALVNLSESLAKNVIF